MEASSLASPARLALGNEHTKLWHEIIDALVPRQLAASLVLPLVVFWILATIALAFDHGYDFLLVGVVVLLVSRAAYRAGVREGRNREAFRRSQMQCEELWRLGLED
jgi:hypothetical protein